jgi:hypothetical protein
MNDGDMQKEPKMKTPWFSVYELRVLFSLSHGLLSYMRQAKLF